MKSLILGFLALTVGLIVVLSGAHKQQVAMAFSSDNSVSNDCSDHLQSYNHHFQSVVRDEEVRTLSSQPLNINAEHNGGISISTWDKPEFSVKLCKQVASDNNEDGKKILSETRLTVDGGAVSVSAPERNNDYNLNTLLLIQAPIDAQVSMKVENGGISIRRFTGTAEAQAVNGGISLKHSNGKITVHAQNGGISIEDCGGDVTAEVQNGGLSIGLPDRWDGKGLDAHTQNGGLVIRFPKNFSSGLEVTASNHVSIVCKGDACEQGQRSWSNGQRMFRLGNGSPQIHAATVNGGIVIENRESTRDSI